MADQAGQAAIKDATPEQIEGPYWTPGSPLRASVVEAGIPGVPLTLTGRVLARTGAPLAGAWVDFWQCDGAGVYDNSGYRLRGHQFTDAEGRYRLDTVIPVEYIDVLEYDGRVVQVHRTAHIHAKVKRSGASTLTTQLYFPDEPYNSEDRLFRPECIMRMGKDGRGVTAYFDFVLPM